MTEYEYKLTEYGYKLNPYRNLRKAKGINGMRRSIRITHNPDKAEQCVQVPVRFPDIRKDDLIVPGSSRLSFKIDLTSEGENADANRTIIVKNLGRAIVSKIIVKLEGQEIFAPNDADIFMCYQDFLENDSREKKIPCIKASRAKRSERSELELETKAQQVKT